MTFRHFALAAALLLTSPAAAQQSTPRENLDCAVWAAYQVGVSDDVEVRNGLSIAVAWFIGLYEGQTGQPINTAMAARSAELDEAGVEALAEGCISRFAAFADWLSTLGASMSESGN
jgi:hypothetical protein